MASFGIHVVTPASTLPVSVAECKQWSRILGRDATDSFIEDLIRTAVDWIESQTQHILQPTTFRMVLDQFPYYVSNRIVPYDFKRAAIILPRNPVTSVDEFSYIDFQGEAASLTGHDYQVGVYNWPARILPVRGKVWPFADPFTVEALQIEFTAGYANASAVPWRAKQAVKYMVAHLYEHREPIQDKTLVQMPVSLQNAINKLRYRGFVA